MSWSEELLVCFHEELKGVVSSIIGCMIKNIWDSFMCVVVGVAWLILENDI